ncbi:unnamed protein product [Kluyveromyces dobzhanskii CBS 2104]|uniref:WGS project CCBQ000000000 data, contig 00041 n=1 Tax=Kluyveromyces dobzhanskii CBS 2104 TaxID=1427455 RepID=A0A0A8L2K7_9SACH|nr:unnamed protein product [Kluyveromyces dobzhanskii CBS 2104]
MQNSAADGSPAAQSQVVGKRLVYAREYTLDLPRISSVELPLKVSAAPESVAKAVDMCGGLGSIKNVLQGRDEGGLELHLNPEKDENNTPTFFNEHPIIGRRVPNRDESVLLKISLPKGTIAKHNGNLQEAIAAATDTKQYRVVPVAVINNTVRFREMSDFQIRLDNVPSANEYNNSFKSLNWDNFKDYVKSIPDYDTKPYENVSSMTLDRSAKIPSFDWQLPAIPRFSMVNIPYIYKYRDNPYAKKSDTGESSVKGTYIKNYQQLVYDFNTTDGIPTEPHPDIVKLFNQGKETGVYPGTGKDVRFLEKLEHCLDILYDLFEKRPIWVKRHIDGIIPLDLHPALKIALSLYSYRFTKGPWRNSYIKLGVDPRTSKDYAQFQTEYFKIERKLLTDPRIKKNLPAPPSKDYQSSVPGQIDPNFEFDGKRIPWYLMLQIDLLFKEPNIFEIYSQTQFLPEVNELTGWFSELDLTKIRKIVKYELGCMVQGNYEFNEHKLTFFKRMIYVKESMIKEKDAEGDVDMDQDDDDDDIDDNGVQEGEIDDELLEEAEQEEAKEATLRSEALEEDQDTEPDNFDIKTASFQEVIEKIAKHDSKSAKFLKDHINGLVKENDLLQ